jgi:hypothetical protein
MSDFHMNQTYNKGARPKMTKIVSNFEDHAEKFYSDKRVHFYNMGFRATYAIIVTLQCNRALFLISVVFWKKN